MKYSGKKVENCFTINEFMQLDAYQNISSDKQD